MRSCNLGGCYCIVRMVNRYALHLLLLIWCIRQSWIYLWPLWRYVKLFRVSIFARCCIISFLFTNRENDGIYKQWCTMMCSDVKWCEVKWSDAQWCSMWLYDVIEFKFCLNCINVWSRWTNITVHRNIFTLWMAHYSYLHTKN